MSRTAEVLEAEVPATLPSNAGGTVDVQVATARQYPRSITRFMQRATELATLTTDIAASCIYALPRSGKTIEGPSARLAEIVAHAWGNLRIQAGVTDSDTRYVTARGEAWDVESNTAIGFEVRRRITTTKGDTYNDDMITVTGNAAASIALRNAVFKVVPSSFWKPIYNKCRLIVAGEVKTFSVRRDEMLKTFAVMGVTEARLCLALGVNGRADITLDHMVTLTGFQNALKDGETTIEDAFPESGGLGSPQPAQRKSEQAAAAATPPAPAPSTNGTGVPAPAASPAPLAYVGVIVAVHERPNGAIVELSTGFKAATKDPTFAAAAKTLRDGKTRVELSTRPSSDPAKYAPTLEEIIPLGEEPAA